MGGRPRRGVVGGIQEPPGELGRLRRRVRELESAEAEHRSVADALRESEAKYRVLLDESSDPIFQFDPDGRYRYVNRAFSEGVGSKVEDIVGRTVWDLFPGEGGDKRFAVVRWVFEHDETRVIEVRVPRPGGDRHYLTTAKPVTDARGTVTSVICISKDITERKRMEEELAHLGTHDVLTGLYNRNYFEVELARVQAGRQYPVSIVVVDLNGLKTVNDRDGHAAGDVLLRATARELRRVFRVEDTIARIGGDEFAVILPGTDEGAAREAVERLRRNIARRKKRGLSLAAGVASGAAGCKLPDVLRRADDRMYQEKAARRNAKISNSTSQTAKVKRSRPK